MKECDERKERERERERETERALERTFYRYVVLLRVCRCAMMKKCGLISE